MNRDQAKELLPVIQAFAEGKDVQWLESCGSEEWITVEDEAYFEEWQWRIKPEPIELWVNVFEDRSTSSHPDQNTANMYASHEAAGKCIACKHILVEPGEGIE